MSEIKGRVKRKLEAILTYGEISTMEKVQSILSLKELAVVDRKAELPDNPMFNASTNVEFRAFMLKAGWIKEVKE